MYAYKYDVGSNIKNDYTTGYLGDATKEVTLTNNSTNRGLWFSDTAYFAAMTDPWFARGGDLGCGVVAGVLNINASFGHASMNGAFRVVFIA